MCPPAKASLVDLTERDVPELARFIAVQAGQSPEERLAHLTWLLLENPARSAAGLPLGYGVRAGSALVGCILYLPQVFVFGGNPLLLLGSSCFYVDERHRGAGGALFLKFSRASAQWPLFANSANAVAAALWKARGATSIPDSDHEFLGIVDWTSIVEELAVRRGMGNALARAVGATTGWLRHFRKLRFPPSPESRLRPLSSVDAVMDLQLAAEPEYVLTARRDEQYLRWRYFSGRDASTVLFVFRGPGDENPTLVAVNERRRGHRGQIKSLNVLDIYPKPDSSQLAAIVGALHEEYRDRTHMIVLRSVDPSCQGVLRKAGFVRRDFDSPNGWLLDRGNLLPSRNFYFVPADGDWII